MGNCIYFCDKHRGLTYENREHIISAAIGGHRTLPKGYVSDQANNFLSQYELECMRYSPLFINRSELGPGKRGSFNIKKIDNPDVLSLEPLTRDHSHYICPLGFLFLGKTYIIPQLVAIFDKTSQNYNVTCIKSNCSEFSDITADSLREQIQNALLSGKVNCKEVPIPYNTKQDFFCIGCYKKKIFFCSTLSNTSIESAIQKIMVKKPIISVSEKELGFSLFTPEFHYSRRFQLENLSYTFLHAKNCFNTLAFFKKDEFVRQSLFDPFRESILSNSKWGDFLVQTNHLLPNVAQWLKKTVQGHEHVSCVYVHTADIMGFSLLYGKSWELFRIASGYLGTPFSNAIVCNFESGTESIFDKIVF